jgi:ABC-type Fe3+-hydroxamate transport system substrate-binding protein
MIEDVGLLVGREQKARQIVADITSRFDQLRARISQYSTTTGSSSYAHSSIPPGKHERTHNTAYLIWKEPYMVAGGRTFINDMMKICGLTNLFEHSTRYPEISVDKLVSLNCSLLLLSSEPYPFNRKNVAELQVRLPYAKILLVDGEMFSWYGSRLLKAPQYFSELLEEVRC